VHRHHALLAGAVHTAKHHPISFDPMTNDSTPAMVTGGSKRLNGALKAIEGMRCVSHYHRKGFVIFIPAGFTLWHVTGSFLSMSRMAQGLPAHSSSGLNVSH
jgi:hypothetical protein